MRFAIWFGMFDRNETLSSLEPTMRNALYALESTLDGMTFSQRLTLYGFATVATVVLFLSYIV